MIREVCSCGAEFESDEKQAVRLLREWRAVHKCVEPQGNQIVVDSATIERSEPSIGFRYDPEEE